MNTKRGGSNLWNHKDYSKEHYRYWKRPWDLRSLKHNVTVSNIANKDTPNYKAFDLVVEEELEKGNGTGKRDGA